MKKTDTNKTNTNKNDFIKRAFEYNRKGFETIFEATDKVQAKVEDYTGQALEHAEFIPEQGRALAKTWIEAGKKARAGLRDNVIKGYERLEALFPAA
ncbi:MAG: hypothetical protein KKD44_20505 [Proteobacteria bacterium]|nr:hypothetical protein [Pseudomonadota bacterium]